MHMKFRPTIFNVMQMDSVNINKDYPLLYITHITNYKPSPSIERYIIYGGPLEYAKHKIFSKYFKYKINSKFLVINYNYSAAAVLNKDRHTFMQGN